MPDNDGWELIGSEGVAGGFPGANSLGCCEGRAFRIAMTQTQPSPSGKEAE